jgi:hypothetical protein
MGGQTYRAFERRRRTDKSAGTSEFQTQCASNRPHLLAWQLRNFALTVVLIGEWLPVVSGLRDFDFSSVQLWMVGVFPK